MFAAVAALLITACRRTEIYSDLGAGTLRASAAHSTHLLAPEVAAQFGDAAFTGEFELAQNSVTRLRGGIAGRDGKLLLTPKDDQSKIDGATATWMIWNNGGYIMSEALQAYAPTAASTNQTGLPANAERDSRAAVPSKIMIGTNITLTISKVSSKAPPPEAFAIPSGFNKYPTPEAMASELLKRRSDAIGANAKARRERFGDSPPVYDVEDLPSPRRP